MARLTITDRLRRLAAAGVFVSVLLTTLACALEEQRGLVVLFTGRRVAL
jgi:hypothetical protein